MRCSSYKSYSLASDHACLCPYQCLLYTATKAQLHGTVDGCLLNLLRLGHVLVAGEYGLVRVNLLLAYDGLLCHLRVLLALFCLVFLESNSK